MNKELTICACTSRVFIDKEKVARLAAIAEVAGWSVRLIPDLCECAEDKSPEMHDIAQTTIAACHERAVKSLVEFCGETPRASLNIRVSDIEDWLKALEIDATTLSADAIAEAETRYKAEIDAMPCKTGKDAWYPTIDKDVCAECGKCLDFCPLGVYAMVDDRVRVVHPHNCKNNCPACARTCPASAVIFPKYDHSPINGGVERQDNAIQLDTKTLYSTAFKEKLAQRRAEGLKLRTKS